VVEVTALREGAYFAEIELAREGQPPLRIDSRPSDAVALALRAKAPILVAPGVFAALAEAKPKSADGDDKWSDILENFNPADTKYKM